MDWMEFSITFTIFSSLLKQTLGHIKYYCTLNVFRKLENFKKNLTIFKILVKTDK